MHPGERPGFFELGREKIEARSRHSALARGAKDRRIHRATGGHDVDGESRDALVPKIGTHREVEATTRADVCVRHAGRDEEVEERAMVRREQDAPIGRQPSQVLGARDEQAIFRERVDERADDAGAPKEAPTPATWRSVQPASEGERRALAT
jgi:hypothetical protein